MIFTDYTGVTTSGTDWQISSVNIYDICYKLTSQFQAMGYLKDMKMSDYIKAVETMLKQERGE